MAIRTTVNLDLETATLLKQEAEKMKMTHSAFIVRISQMLMKRAKSLHRAEGTVRYQKRNASAGWNTVHVQFEQNEYSSFIDMRNLFKSSVSRLIALVFQDYLISKRKMTHNDFLMKFSDKKQYTGHKVEYNNFKTFILWKIYWLSPT